MAEHTKIITLDNDWSIYLKWNSTRTGFRHTAKLKNKFFDDVSISTRHYLNRTWEDFTYATVVKEALDYFDDEKTRQKFYKQVEQEV